MSGDHNPMHMDPIAARRTQAGVPAVHGMHLLLWSLESLLQAGKIDRPIMSISAVFSRFVRLHAPTRLRILQHDEAAIEVAVDAAEVETGTITARFGASAVNVPARSDLPAIEHPDAVAREVSLLEMKGYQGWIDRTPGYADAADMFPQLAAAIGVGRVIAIAQLSCLVGMICPGLHSIFGGLDIALTSTADRPGIGFEVAVVSPRTRLVRMKVAGSGVSGIVNSFSRWPPVPQRSIEELSGVVQPGEFAGSTALITGGSRGLGALTAKILAAGGARVRISYAVGAGDAAELEQEINRFTGGSNCTSMQYDVMQPVAEPMRWFCRDVSHFYHFASPRIYRQKARVFEPGLLEEFMTAYVTAFEQLCSAIQAQGAGRLVAFFPSSVFVGDDRPRDMVEYAMAKAAGEVLCEEMARTNGMAHAIFQRLPRMLTDQTASLIPTMSLDPLETMLPVIRTVQTTAAG
jgi:hypothetical protein